MPSLNSKTVSSRWGRVCIVCMCWIVSLQGQAISRSDICLGPSLVEGVGLCVDERRGCCAFCGVLCRRALGSGRMGGRNDVADVSVCGV